jgi:hypothetical protein
VTSLLDLVRQASPEGILDSLVEDLLRTIEVTVATLTQTAEEVGRAAVADLIATIGSILPVPFSNATLPSPPPDVPVTARRVGAQGWEVSIALPRLEIEIPGLAAGKVEGTDDDARVSRAPELEPVRLVLDASGADGLPVLVVRALNGSDVSITLDTARVRLEPPVLALPFGFGASVGEVRFEPSGVSMPDFEFYLPPIPRLPVSKIPAPVTIGALEAPNPGVNLQVPHEIPFPRAGAPANLEIFVTRPSARTLLDLVPTRVSFSLPLDGGSFEIDTNHPIEPAAVGGGSLRISGDLGVTEDDATLHAELEGAGGADGLATVGGPSLALAAAIAPHVLPPDARDAAATAIIAAVASGQLPGTEGDGEVVIHALSIDANWSRNEAVPSGLTVRLDYEARLGVDVSAGSMQVRTKPGKPMRVRYRDVGVTTSSPPLLTWENSPMNLVSTGDWEVKGIPEDLLRIGDIRAGRGSLVIDIDLQTAVSLGVVTVDSTTVRISIDDSPSVMPAGFGIGVDLPGVLKGHGQLVFPPDGGFGAALDVSLPTIGASGRAVVAIGDPLVVVAFEARLFAPIPFANSGLGLFGMSGALASGAARVLPTEADPIIREVRWNPFNPAAWADGSQVFVGVGADIGTVPDMGFAFSSRAGILVGLPDPLFRVSLEAQLLRGATGRLTGVLLITEDAVTAGVMGDYTIPVLLQTQVPGGGVFPIASPESWEARLGGDGDSGRMQPVTIHILPDLLDLDARAFVMAFGNAATTVGATMAPPGLTLDGLSLAFGAGVDVHWAAGPFSFDAHGVVLAALTHKPPKPASEARPWMLVGMAEIRGSVDLGPVSIGASAQLDVLVQDDPVVVYGHAKACASVDLWLTEIEGCVEFDIGDPPPLEVPDPESPFGVMHLTDRMGLIVESIPDGASVPTVWADAIPVLTFSHWVAAARPIVGIRQPIGDWVPDDNGWIGTAELQYRFELRAVHVHERLPDGTEQDVGTSWDASWQLPIGSDVWGGGAVPAEARALALGILDPLHRLQPATSLGPAAGDPIDLLGRLCLPLAPPGRTWFHGDATTFGGLNGPVRVPPSPPPRRSIDLGPLEVQVLDRDERPVPLDEDVDAVAAELGGEFAPAWVDPDPDPIVLEDQTFGGRLWLPRIEQQNESFATVVLRPTDAIDDCLLFLATDAERQEQPAVVSGADGTPWDYQGVVATWGLHNVHLFTSPGRTRRVHLQGFQAPVALVGLGAVGAQVRAQFGANERGRRATQDGLANAASDAGTTRRMLVPGAQYRVEIELAWEGKGINREERSGTFTAGPFSFRVASKGTRPAPGGQVGRPTKLPEFPVDQVVVFRELAAASIAASRRYDETVLDRADLGRYVGGFAPIDGTTDHFLDDPVQVLFTVDHLPDLAARYEEQLSVVAVRTEGPPDAGPADVATTLGAVATVALDRPAPGDPVIAPLTTTHLTTLDAARSVFIDASTDDPGCRIRRPGAVVQPLGRLVPSSTYQLGVHVDAAPAGGPPEPAGSHDPIAASMFRTSRYRNPVDLLEKLGFTSVGGGQLASLPLPAQAAAGIGGLVTAGDHIGTPFETALRQLGLDGYRPPLAPLASALWIAAPDGVWLLTGLLLECPEPIWRPGRLDPVRVRLGSTDIAARYWDGRRTRLLALVAPTTSGDVRAELTIADTSPGAAAGTSRTVRATVPVFSPLKGILP